MGRIKKQQGFPKPLQANLLVTNSQRKVPLSKSSAEEILFFLIKKFQTQPVALHFVSAKKISDLHRLFFHDPNPTDCITLPFKDPNFLGEIFVCPQIAFEYVNEHGGNLVDEITLYIVHGFLHLMGMEDQSEAGIQSMRKAEKQLMKTLAKNNLGVTIMVK